jgi:hypothetical protein
VLRTGGGAAAGEKADISHAPDEEERKMKMKRKRRAGVAE